MLRGNSTYVYDGNWKLQTENGADGYHVSAVHWNYAATTGRRKERRRRPTPRDGRRRLGQAGRWLLLPSRTATCCSGPTGPTRRIVRTWEPRRRTGRAFGQERADWMVQRSRNLCLYPNVYLMDQFSSQIRVYPADRVDKTEVTIYCIAPKGEAPTERARRIRQYEDFFNASGMGTPDDLEEFRACQIGYLGTAALLERHVPGRDRTGSRAPDENAEAIGLKPLLSGERSEDEGLFVAPAQILGADAMREALRDGERAEARHDRCDRGHRPSSSIEDLRPSCIAKRALLDDRQWDEWLTCYAADVEFWMPSWDDDDQLTEDPQQQISLIYYRTGRVWRTACSGSGPSAPAPRTAGAAHLPQHHQRRDRWSSAMGRSRPALQLAHAQPPLQDDRQLLRHHILHARHKRRASR